MSTREKVLRFIHSYWRERAFGPTTREIARGVGLKSNSTAALHLANLHDDGLITWANHDDGTMVTRSVRTTAEGRAVASTPLPPTPCPECGSTHYQKLRSRSGRWWRCDDCGYVEAIEQGEEAVV